jgi:vacuolar-type H+-ATPase subunit E/Vma4
MSKEEILESLKDILEEINETPDGYFVDIVFIQETIQDILNKSNYE